MKQSDPSKATITAALGFCELAMWQAAWDELETLPPEERARIDVLRVRLGIFIALKRWESAATLAEGMIARGEDSAATWLLGANAIRRSRSVQEARAFLLRVEKTLDHNATYHYSLAAYECQLGNLIGAKARLKHAFSLNPDLRAVALEDMDLSAIW